MERGGESKQETERTPENRFPVPQDKTQPETKNDKQKR